LYFLHMMHHAEYWLHIELWAFFHMLLWQAASTNIAQYCRLDVSAIHQCMSLYIVYFFKRQQKMSKYYLC
jgi:hypothetical protein